LATANDFGVTCVSVCTVGDLGYYFIGQVDTYSSS